MIDRRLHRRIITLRNFGWFILVLVFALATVNVVSEFRAPRGNDYGRLSKREPRQEVTVSTQAPEVVQEAPTPPAIGGADALVRPPVELTPATEQPRLDAAAWRAGAPAAPADGRIAIVGDQSGVTVISPKRKLRGGFPER